MNIMNIINHKWILGRTPIPKPWPPEPPPPLGATAAPTPNPHAACRRPARRWRWWGPAPRSRDASAGRPAAVTDVGPMWDRMWRAYPPNLLVSHCFRLQIVILLELSGRYHKVSHGIPHFQTQLIPVLTPPGPNWSQKLDRRSRHLSRIPIRDGWDGW